MTAPVNDTPERCAHRPGDDTCRGVPSECGCGSDTGMNPEAVEAIRIADKHLAGETKQRRMALALDIQNAIINHAGTIAMDAIRIGFEKTRKAEGPNA